MTRMTTRASIRSLTLALVFGASTAAAALDTLSKARLAAVDGDHAACAELADKARRLPDSVWHAHHVYATCQIYAVEARKDSITPAQYVDGIAKAIDALRFLLDTPGLLVFQEQRASVEFMVEELAKRIDVARAGGSEAR